MIRVLAFIRRLPGVSRDDFRVHYEEVHVGVALPFLTGTASYVRHHVREEIHGSPDFDCMTRFDYPDGETVKAVFERTEGPRADAIRRDEATFMDKPAIRFFPVEALPAWESGAPGAVPAVFLVCVRRPEGEAPETFRAQFLEEGLPALRAATKDPRGCRPQLALPGLAQGSAFDAVVELGATGAGELARAARALEASGARVIAVRVSVHETRMPG